MNAGICISEAHLSSAVEIAFIVSG